MLVRFAALLVFLWGATSMAIETPKYEVLEKYDGFEVRRYASYVVAETEVDGSRGDAGNAGFRLLAGYIFGGNTSSSRIDMTTPVTQAQKIEMTSPVTQTQSGAQWKVQFSMPAKWTVDNLPTPKDPRVTLRVVPERVVAVLRYSGTWSEANYQQHLTALKEGLTREGLSSKGEPTWARYDPPWTPWFLRQNEVQLELASPPPGT